MTQTTVMTDTHVILELKGEARISAETPIERAGPLKTKEESTVVHWTREQRGIHGLVTARLLALTGRWILASTAVAVSAGLIPAIMWVASQRFPIPGGRPADRSLVG